MSPKRKRLLLVGGGIVLLILVATAPLMLRGWRQKKSFDNFFKEYSSALVQGDFRQAYETAGTEFRNATTFDEFLQQHQTLAIERGKLISVRQGRTIVDGTGSPLAWVAVTTAALNFNHGSVNVTYEFHSDGSAWRLYGFRRD